MVGGEEGLSGLGPASGGVASPTGNVGPRRGDVGVCDLIGLKFDEEAWPGVERAGLLDADDDNCGLRPRRASVPAMSEILARS